MILYGIIGLILYDLDYLTSTNEFFKSLGFILILSCAWPLVLVVELYKKYLHTT